MKNSCANCSKPIDHSEQIGLCLACFTRVAVVMYYPNKTINNHIKIQPEVVINLLQDSDLELVKLLFAFQCHPFFDWYEYLEARDAFYDSREWKELRYSIFKKYACKCMCCGATAATAVIQCDHIQPLSKRWDLRLDPNNLQLLCADCNSGKSNNHSDDFRPKINVDSI